MGDNTDLMEKRRARRQRKILASAESRLNMITGTQLGTSYIYIYMTMTTR